MHDVIKIGIIGMSAGNAHPFSWSSIINGHYNAKVIEDAGYPAVSAYLNANSDTLGIGGAKVTYIWTQDQGLSRSIANSAAIDNVAIQLEDMIGKVDVVILSRDDAENHVSMSKPFIEAGIPIFIDKPLAFTEPDLSWFATQSRNGKFIMSCSSMRYSNECRTVISEMDSLGKIEFVTAVGKKDWQKYGVHMLEAVFSLLHDPVPLAVKHIGSEGKDSVVVEFENGIRAFIHLFLEIAPTFQVSVFGKHGWRIAEIKNSYSMFRDNIIEFLRSVREGKPRLAFYKTENIIKVLIAAKRSLDEGGSIIYFK